MADVRANMAAVTLRWLKLRFCSKALFKQTPPLLGIVQHLGETLAVTSSFNIHVTARQRDYHRHNYCGVGIALASGD